MLRNLLTSVIIWIYDTYKNFVSIPNHKIEHVSMEYFTNNDKTYSINGPFWENESDKWDGLFDEHYVESKDMNYTAEDTPENVSIPPIILTQRHATPQKTATVRGIWSRSAARPPQFSPCCVGRRNSG